MSILRQSPRAGIGRENQDAQSMLCSKHSHGMPCSSSRWATHRHPHSSFLQRRRTHFLSLFPESFTSPSAASQLGFGGSCRTPALTAGGHREVATGLLRDQGFAVALPSTVWAQGGHSSPFWGWLVPQHLGTPVCQLSVGNWRSWVILHRSSLQNHVFPALGFSRTSLWYSSDI